MNGGLLVKVLPKGQVTIPVRFRRKLGIKKDGYLAVQLVGGKLMMRPAGANWEERYVRKYTDRDIKEFIEADKLSAKERRAAQQWLKSIR